MREMEAAIKTVVNVFLKSSKGKPGLDSKTFQKLVESQFSNILTDTDSKEAVKELRMGLDDNQDGKVGFEEYMKLIGYLANTVSDQHTRGNEQPNQKAAVAVAESAPAAAKAAEGKPPVASEEQEEEEEEEEVVEGEATHSVEKAED